LVVYYPPNLPVENIGERILLNFKMVLKFNSIFTRQKLSHFDGLIFQFSFRSILVEKNTRENILLKNTFADILTFCIKIYRSLNF